MSWFSSKENDTKIRIDLIDEKTRELDEKTRALDEKTRELDEKTRALDEKTRELDEKINVFDTWHKDIMNSIRFEIKEALVKYENNKSVKSVKTVLYYDGSLYQGHMENNLPHGFGVIVHGNGVRYAGNWKNGLYDGSGVLYYPGMPPWNAMWKLHVPHGKCTYDFINFTEYVDGVIQ